MKYILLTLFTSSILLSCTTLLNEKTSNSLLKTQKQLPEWEKYIPRNSRTPLIDYSSVGVNYSNAEIPHINLPIFSVTDFGAVANDDKEDKEAIQKAILAAEAADGGVVFFPPGRYLINEQTKQRAGIKISKPNIILRGSGNNINGTELFMRYPLAPQDPKKMWTVPSMIKFQHELASAPSSTSIGKFIAESEITSNTQQNSIFVNVKDPSKFKANDTVTIEMQNTSANDDFMFGKKPRANWQQVIDKGVMAAETLEVSHISGSKVYFKQPLITRIKAKYGWKIRSVHTLKNVGIEHLAFTGNFKEKFIHHKNATHDSGYSAIQLTRTSHSWVKNIVFRNVSVAASISGGVANTLMHNVIEGNSGHACFNITFGTRNLTAMNIDKTNNGQWHGPGTSHASVGNVIWRFISPKSRGIDSHGGFPRYTLYDNVTSFGFGGWGGNYKNLPNHLEGLIFWNFIQTGEKVGEWHKGDFNFWDINDSTKDQPYTFFTAINPTIIGYEGSATGYNKKHTGQVTSFGKNVPLDSLFEAQLIYRLGTEPEWINKALLDWKILKNRHLAQK